MFERYPREGEVVAGSDDDQLAFEVGRISVVGFGGVSLSGVAR